MMSDANRRLGSGSLVIATHNQGKLKEIGALLEPYGLTCLSAGSLGLPEPAETGSTFAENALIKAHAAAQGSGIVALADDSGLAVDALDGKPGVYTADWAERQWFEGDAGRDWYMAMGKVEGMLSQRGPGVDRSAAFHCVLAIAWPNGQSAVYQGMAPGALIWPPRGELGFGYDPMFVPANAVGDRQHTFAEMSPQEKHAISHRADAFAKLVAEQFASTS